MTFDEYQQQASKTAIYKDKLIYPALGLGSEAGEVLDKVKKTLRDRSGVFNDDTKYAIASELGDVLWYISAMLTDMGISLDVVAQNNLAKLNSRQERNVIHGSGDHR